jgi:hypothetical protein
MNPAFLAAAPGLLSLGKRAARRLVVPPPPWYDGLSPPTGIMGWFPLVLWAMFSLVEWVVSPLSLRVVLPAPYYGLSPTFGIIGCLPPHWYHGAVRPIANPLNVPGIAPADARIRPVRARPGPLL